MTGSRTYARVIGSEPALALAPVQLGPPADTLTSASKVTTLRPGRSAQKSGLARLIRSMTEVRTPVAMTTSSTRLSPNAVLTSTYSVAAMLPVISSTSPVVRLRMRAVVTSPYRRAVIGASTSPRLAISTSTLLRGHLERELERRTPKPPVPVNSTWVSAIARQYGSGASHSRSNGAIAFVPAGRSTDALRGSARSSSGCAAVEGHPQAAEGVRLAEAGRLLDERAQERGAQVPGGGGRGRLRGARRGSRPGAARRRRARSRPAGSGDFTVDGLDRHGLGALEAQQPQRRRGAGREPRRRRAVGREPLDEGGHRYAPSSDQARAARRRARRVSRSTSPGCDAVDRLAADERPGATGRRRPAGRGSGPR